MVDKFLDIMHGVEIPIEVEIIKTKRYPEFFYKKQQNTNTNYEPSIRILS